MMTTRDFEQLHDRFVAMTDAGRYVQLEYPVTGKTAWRIEEAAAEVGLVELEREAIGLAVELGESSRLGTYAAGLLRRRATDSMGNWMAGKTWDETDWRWLAIELAGVRPVFRSMPSDDDVRWLRGETTATAAEISAKALRLMMTAEAEQAVDLSREVSINDVWAGLELVVGHNLVKFKRHLKRWGVTHPTSLEELVEILDKKAVSPGLYRSACGELAVRIRSGEWPPQNNLGQ